MTSYVSHTTIKAHNAYELSEFYKQVLGYDDMPGDPNQPGHIECPIVDPLSGHTLLFLQVADETLPPNRTHLDLRPRESSRDEEVARIQALGATFVADQRGPNEGWVVFADPEGNEFCVLRSLNEVAAAMAAQGEV